MQSGLYTNAQGILLSKRDKTYVDISLAWEPSALTGDITTLRDTRAIDNSIKNIIMTYPLEMPFEAEFGSEVSTLLFDPCDLGTAGILSLEIEKAIEANEPRVEIVEISVLPETTGRENQIIQDRSNSQTYSDVENGMNYRDFSGTKAATDYNSGRSQARNPHQTPEIVQEGLAGSGAFTVNIAYRIIGTEEIFEVSELLVPTR